MEGIGLGSYRFAGAPKRDGAPRLERVTVVGATADAVYRGQAAVDASCLARDLINAAPRDLTPHRARAWAATRAARGTGVSVDVWDERRIAAERLGGLAGVAAGASQPPRLIRMSYEAGRNRPTVALVGKGITFDSGGLSLKTPAGMMTMKMDMGGAAAAICGTVALARLASRSTSRAGSPPRRTCRAGPPSTPATSCGSATARPSRFSNTDAEGRLVLADALSLAVEEKPDAIVDLATLTGAQVVALGGSVAAVMGNDADLVRKVIAAGDLAGNRPGSSRFTRRIASSWTQTWRMSRTCRRGNGAGSIIAGLFLKEFVGDIPWAHLDIAGPAWTDSEDGYKTRGGTGWGTRTLIELVSAWS